MIRKTIHAMILMLALFGSRASAQTYSDLFIETQDVQSVPLTSFDNITFAQGNMNLRNGTTTVKAFSLAHLKKLYFGSATAIATPLADDGWSSAVVYDLQGRKLADSYQQFAGGSHPSKGIYILRQGNGTRKISVE